MQKQHELNLRRHNSLLFLGMISNLKLIERHGTNLNAMSLKGYFMNQIPSETQDLHPLNKNSLQNLKSDIGTQIHIRLTIFPATEYITPQIQI